MTLRPKANTGRSGKGHKAYHYRIKATENRSAGPGLAGWQELCFDGQGL